MKSIIFRFSKFSYLKNFAIAFICIFVLVVSLNISTVEAKNKKGGGGSCSHTVSCSFTAVKSGVTYTGDQTMTSPACMSSSNPCSEGRIDGQILAVIAPNMLSGTVYPACGNSHSWNARIIGGYTTPGVPPGSPQTTPTTTTTGKTTLTRNCTPGVDCPETDLGKVITKASLSPSIANSSTHTCPFFWEVGSEDSTRKISCQIVTNGKITIVPKIELDKTNGYPLPIGISNFICSRSDGTSTTTESKTLSCNGNPNTIER